MTNDDIHFENLLTPQQVAKILNVSLKTLAQWRWSGRKDLPFVSYGRNVWYQPTDLKAFIAANTHRSTAEYSRKRMAAREASHD